MSRLIVDPSMEAQLRNLGQTLEVCDSSGHLLGHFVPALDLAHHRPMEPTISEEELTRREHADGGRSLAEILADLERRA